jgi:hypothetical protein
MMPGSTDLNKKTNHMQREDWIEVFLKVLMVMFISLIMFLAIY